VLRFSAIQASRMISIGIAFEDQRPEPQRHEVTQRVENASPS
jgi:hypothetical protein